MECQRPGGCTAVRLRFQGSGSRVEVKGLGLRDSRFRIIRVRVLGLLLTGLRDFGASSSRVCSRASVTILG